MQQYAQVRLHHNAQSLRSLTAVRYEQHSLLPEGHTYTLHYGYSNLLQDSGQNDCLWEANHEVATQLTALKFHIQQTIPKSKGKSALSFSFSRLGTIVTYSPHGWTDIWKELKVEIEIWSTFLG